MTDYGTTRARVLGEAAKAVLRDRNKSYGSPEDNFRDIADLWNGYLGPLLSRPITPHEVAILNILQKVARAKSSPAHLDHWTDIAGYAACGGEVSASMDKDWRFSGE